jgi:poly(3-hydroxybutyrate) depolymerase
MTLFGGKIDPRISPTPSDLLAKRQSIAWLEQNCVTEVAPSEAGAGRLVYPASRQKAVLLAYLTRHLLAGGELCSKLIEAGGEDPAARSFLDRFFSVADPPAEFFLETIISVFQRFDFPCGRLMWRNEAIDPAAITRTALFTIEGAQDDVSGPGQTHVAHDLCANIPKLRRESYMQSGVGHFGLFHGAIWRSTTLPRVRRFIREQDRGNRGASLSSRMVKSSVPGPSN